MKVQLDLTLNENKILKDKNEFDHVLKKNEVLSSKLDFVLIEKESLKNKIVLISNKLDLISKKNISLKNNIDSHVCHASPPSIPIACFSSSHVENDINILKKNVDCLGSTLSQCAMNHTQLELSLIHI